MSKEIGVSISLQLVNATLKDPRLVVAVQPTQVTQGMMSNTQTIGLTPEALDLGDVATPGWSMFQNLDAANFVTLGSLDSGSVFIPFTKLLPGEPQGFRLGTAAPYAKADDTASAAAPVKLYYKIYEV